jgi:hypothetical protein
MFRMQNVNTEKGSIDVDSKISLTLPCFFLFLPCFFCFCLFLPCYFFCDAPELSVSIRRSEATHPAQLTCHVAQPAHNQRFQNEIDWTI